MKKCFLLFLLSFSTAIFAQPVCQWAYIPVGSVQTYNTIYITTTDQVGNIYQVGKLLGVADMDPASGATDTSFSFPSYNYYISKTNISGKLQWIHYFQKNSQFGLFEFKGLKINSTNEIIVAGNFFGMVDFDLSDNGVDTLRSHFPTYPDYFVAKYDSSGNYQWAFNIGDPTTSSIEVQAVTIMPNNNIVITANPNGTIDVDPGIAVHNSIGGNANLICYDTYGNYIWNNHITPTYSYSITNNSLDCDASGNTYLLTVGYYELTVNKFANNGIAVWDKTIGDFVLGARVNPQSVLVNKVTGDFYVAGTFGGTVDFDPGAPILNYTSSSCFFQDGFIAKYDPNMNPLWVNTYVGNVSFGNFSLDFDNSDIIAVGDLNGTIDFGNGFIFSSPSLYKPFYLKINSNGITQDAYTLNGFGKYNTINTTINNSFVTSGNISTTTDMDPTSATLQLSATTSNFFNAVYQNNSVTVLNEINTTAEVLLFPNPAGDQINLKVNKRLIGSTFELSDISGKVLLHGKITNENTLLALDQFESGIYLISIEADLMQKFKIVKI